MRTKASKAEVERRIAVTLDLLTQGKATGDIKRALNQRFKVKHRQANTYIARARQQLLEEIGIERSELVAKHYGIYMRAISDPRATIRDQLAAVKAADELLGLQAPRKVAPTSPDGGEAYHKHVMQELMKLCEDSKVAPVIDSAFIAEAAGGEAKSSEQGRCDDGGGR